MKQRTMRAGVLLLGAMMMTAGASAQVSGELGLTVNLEHSQVAQTGTPGFWFKGAAVDGSVNLYKGLGLAAEFSGGHVRIGPGVTLGKLTFMGGPRYTAPVARTRGRVFVEALFGTVHGFDGLFPSGSTTVATANGLSLQFGGGLEYPLQHGFALRPVELDYVHTNLPNNAANSQNDFRFASGVSYHFGR